MKRFTILFLSFYLSINSFGKTYQNKEIKIPYTDGVEVFSICKTNPTISFDEKKEYYWYTEFSKIKSTKGGCGGNLLNGNYKFYDEDGSLKIDRNYFLGLKDGNEITWDSLGSIIGKATYKTGNLIYAKFLNKENYWMEFIGAILEVGSIKKVYTKHHTLISEWKILENFKYHIKNYYEYPTGQLKEEYTSSFNVKDMFGKYVSYYKNGKIKVDGQFYEGKFMRSGKVGTWKSYNEDGTLDSKSNYKVEVLHWATGKLKSAGGFIYNIDIDEWVKIGVWRWYDKTGKFSEKKEYRGGIEITE